MNQKIIKMLLGILTAIALLIAIYYSAIWASNYIDRKLNGVKAGVTLEYFQLEGYFQEEVESIVEVLALEVERKPQNANLNRKTGEILPSKAGIAVDRKKTVRNIMTASENERFKLETTVVEPNLTTEKLKSISLPLGSYTTYFAGSANRYNNIQVAMNSINNRIVMPGEVFSFNETTGPKTEKNGYKPAPVIVGGSMAQGLGGGVCQASSTLYNAVLKSNLEVVERHSHSKPVRYVPKGRDAAVAEGNIDFRFKNNLEEPIIIKASVYQSRIEATILGVNE